MEIGSCFEARKLVTPTFQLFVNDPSRVRAPKLPEVLHKEIGFGIGVMPAPAQERPTLPGCRVDRSIAEEVVYGHGRQLSTLHDCRPRALP